MTVRVFAPAKVNLTLHVTGQRADSYHTLDSLVIFADVGDQIEVSDASSTTITVRGPFSSAVPKDGSNLVLQAAQAMASSRGAAITLTKNLPAAAGIGGGSSDAAATMRALSELWNVGLPNPDLARRIGADVPVCLSPRPTRMAGIGDVLAEVPELPTLHMVLVNPGVEMATPRVFRELVKKKNAAMPTPLPKWKDTESLCEWLSKQRNDLEIPACTISPIIRETLDCISSTNDCLLSRMSGSGGTCFGLFCTQLAAQKAAMSISAQQPDWWVKPARNWQHPS